jgi:type III secretion system YscJ/HrcJ family lipoprotein
VTRASTPPCRAGLAAFAVGAVLAGCGVPVAVDLDEPEANRVVAALDANGVAADRTQEPGGARHFRVEVSRGDAARAVAVLTQEELPRRPSPGLLEALGEGALVPSRAAEQARIAVGTAGELERTLASADGVVSARVHLSVPPHDPLADSAAEPPRASVLLR